MNNVQKAIRVIANIIGIPENELFVKCRRRERVVARYCLCLYLHETLQLSYHTIANIVKLDHATVVYAVKEMQKRIASKFYIYDKNIWDEFITKLKE